MPFPRHFHRHQSKTLTRRWARMLALGLMTQCMTWSLNGLMSSSLAGEMADAEQKSRIIETLHDNDLMPFSKKACPDVRLDRSRGLVIIYLYQDKRARANDLKIDTVIAARLINKLGLDWVQAVETHFFASEDQSRFTLARVEMDLIDSFAQGQIDQKTLLSLVTTGQNQLPGLKERYAGWSYRQILTGAPSVKTESASALTAKDGESVRLVLTDSDKVE